MVKYFAVILLLLFSISCKEKSVTEPGTEKSRSYYLGFSPFPYDITAEAVEYSYKKISSDADIIAHHFDDGIPWKEALEDKDFHQNIMADWQYRKTHTPVGHKVYLAITPINITRNGLAPYKGEKENMPLPTPWNTYSFNNHDVKTAYLNYAKRIINYFNPDYVTIGVEVNLLADSDSSMVKWKEYLELHKFVYTQLKKLYSTLPIMVSFTGMDLIDGYTDVNHSSQTKVLNEIINYTDYFGLSMHTFLSKFLADTIDSAIFKNIFSLSNKPIAICETSYPAEKFSILNNSVVFKGSEEKQKKYFELLFSASETYHVEFIINFVIRDYDALWEAIGSPDNIEKVWRDTGFYNEKGTSRKVRDFWLQNLQLKVQ
ncbi:hypothetical protein BMS3Abin04_02798 [bacterium BMS3Abin04]|nr:hypothetical protein BMS3Abin04_02798 [bacterium BMS3Abin04]